MRYLDTLSELAAPAVAEWQANQRLRQGGMAICAILLLYSFLVLSDSAAAQMEDMQGLQARHDRIAGLESQQFWLQRAQEGEQLLTQLRASFPVAGSAGRAEAEVRGVLSGALQRAEAGRLKLDMDPAEQVGDSNLWKVSAGINGLANGDQLRSLLRDIESGPGNVQIAELRLVRGKNAVKIRVEISLEAYFQRSG